MSEVCCIRPVALPDLPTILAWRNHPDVRRFMFTQHEISLQEHTAWFEKTSHVDTRRLLIVEEKHIPIGYVQFSQVRMGGVADWGFYASPDAPKGAGRKLGIAALNHAFGVLGLHKVCGQAIEENTASIGFHQALGFKQEGVLREQKYIQEKYQDVICFGLLAHEWALTSPHQEYTT